MNRVPRKTECSPLGRDHGGNDSIDNLLCVCPNCHTKLDYGCIKLSLSSLRILPGHKISRRNVDYHNKKIYGQKITG